MPWADGLKMSAWLKLKRHFYFSCHKATWQISWQSSFSIVVHSCQQSVNSRGTEQNENRPGSQEYSRRHKHLRSTLWKQFCRPGIWCIDLNFWHPSSPLYQYVSINNFKKFGLERPNTKLHFFLISTWINTWPSLYRHHWSQAIPWRTLEAPSTGPPGGRFFLLQKSEGWDLWLCSCVHLIMWWAALVKTLMT